MTHNNSQQSKWKTWKLIHVIANLGFDNFSGYTFIIIERALDRAILDEIQNVITLNKLKKNAKHIWTLTSAFVLLFFATVVAVEAICAFSKWGKKNYSPMKQWVNVNSCCCFTKGLGQRGGT